MCIGSKINLKFIEEMLRIILSVDTNTLKKSIKKFILLGKSKFCASEREKKLSLNRA